MAVLEGIALKGLSTITTTLVKKFVELGWTRIAEEFENTFSDDDLINYCKACDEYVNIRTLYSSQHDVFIDDVYVPLFMSPTNDPATKYEISNLNYYSEGITNIIGKAGQGKSTFLRKMLINELKEGKCIPVFFELKYIKTDITLINQLSTWFCEHNLNIKEKGVDRLLKGGFLKIFFDGFDEIPPKEHDDALKLIKDLSRAFPKVTIIVTSRPDTIITTEPYISNYNVLELDEDNVRQLFLNISDNNLDSTNDAMEQIEKYPSISDITKTPILAILLFITYRSWSKIPDNLADFYQKIFITLLTHHDSLKPGKKIDRGIEIPLNDRQIEDIFCVFCFATFSQGIDTFSMREASNYMQTAIESELLNDICPQNLVDIIKKCTGIICSDGYDQLTFSHKSLQEYYTAVYIKQQSPHDIRKFYNSVKFVEEERQYSAVISFLKAIDQNKYTKYYYIPCFEEMFEVDNIPNNISNDLRKLCIEKVISRIEIPFPKREDKTDKSSQSKKKTTFQIGLNVNLDDTKSSMFYVRFFQQIMLSLLTSGVYLSYITLKKEEMETENASDEDIPLKTLLTYVNEEESRDFLNQIYDFFDKDIGYEHKYLMAAYKANKKPSLLNKVFSK